MSQSALISVLMPVYNGAAYLEAAIWSILRQTYSNLELIVIDDGSSDNSAEIAEACARHDARVVVRSQANGGVARALNQGLAMARGSYIARMDSDDISHPTRLEKQLDFLTANPAVGVLGTSIYTIDTAGARTSTGLLYTVSEPGILRWHTFFRNPFCHPTVMMPAALLESVGGYAEQRLGQDYDLWTRLWERTQFANLTEPLLAYRIHAKSVTATKARQLERTQGSGKSRQALVSAVLGRPISLETCIMLGSQRTDSAAEAEEVGAVLTGLWHALAHDSRLTEREKSWIRMDYLIRLVRLWRPYLFSAHGRKFIRNFSVRDLLLVGQLSARLRERGLSLR